MPTRGRGTPRRSDTRLFEHPDFEDAVLHAEQQLRDQGIRAALIEKDYYVTETLRVIASRLGDRVVFKGGTSLSKGWGLIQRFSEDVDIFVDPDAFSPRLGSKRVDRELKQLRDAIGAHPGLELDPDAGATSKGASRSDVFAYRSRFGTPGDVAPRVLVESGIGSGRRPTERRRLESLLARCLREIDTSLGASDEAPMVAGREQQEAA